MILGAQLMRMFSRAGLAAAIITTGLAATAQAQVPEPSADPDTTDTAAPQTPPARPDAARRVVRLFDFEEQTTNPTPVPRYWVRAQDERTIEGGVERVLRDRPGFPAWNQPRLDYSSPAFHGGGSVRLGTTGGSASLKLEPGVIPVFQNADYTVSAHVRTEHLRHARARLVARFLDAAGRPVPDAEFASAPAATESEWAAVSVEAEGKFTKAAFLELELQLLQPDQIAAHEPGRVTEQDLDGSAWFDDVTVSQLPRLELDVSAPGNTVRAPEKPELVLSIRDLTGEELEARLVLFDASGRIADSRRQRVPAGHARVTWAPDIHALGWYRAVVRVSNARSTVGEASTDFAWVDRDVPAPVSAPDHGPTTPAPPIFGLSFSAPPRPAWPLADMARRIGARSIDLPIDAASLTADNASDRARAYAPVLSSLFEADIDAGIVLDQCPADLAASRRADPDDLWALLTDAPQTWGPYLDPLLDRFAQRARRWQIGRPDRDIAFWRPGLARDLTSVTASLSRLVPSPILAVPWRLDRGLDVAVFARRADQVRVCVLVPSDAAPDAVVGFADRWSAAFPDGRAPALTLNFEGAALADDPADPDAIADVVKRAVRFIAARDLRAGPSVGRGAPTLSLLDPWTSDDARSASPRPRPELPAWANLVRRLSGRRVRCELPIADGVRCYILTPPAGSPDAEGALVAWNESADPADAVVRLPKDQSAARVFDLFGNETPAPTEDADPDPTRSPTDAPRRRPDLVVPVGPRPVFVEGIDAALAEFLASVKIDPDRLLATNQTHEHAITFVNPWSTAADVRSFIIQPGGIDAEGRKDRTWRLTPRASRALVPPGQPGRIPVSIAFTPAEEAGPKEFVIDLDVTAERPYGLVRVRRRIDLGIDGLLLDVATRARADGGVIVEARVTNAGTRPLDLELTAFAPGQPRLKNQITKLAPGANATRRFPYAAGAQALRGRRVVVAATEIESKARLNKSVEIE